MAFGAGISDHERVAALGRSSDAVATMDIRGYRSNRVLLHYGGSIGSSRVMDLAARDTWPADGVRFLIPVATSVAVQIGYVALRGPFTASCGLVTVPTDVDDPKQAFLCAGSPRGALFWGDEIPMQVDGNNADQPFSTDADNGGFWLGMSDGVNEGMCSIVDDGSATESHAGRIFTTSKAAAHHLADAAGGSPTVVSEADASIVDGTMLLDWTTVDTREREFNYLIIGERPADWQETKESMAVTTSTRASRG